MIKQNTTGYRVYLPPPSSRSSDMGVLGAREQRRPVRRELPDDRTTGADQQLGGPESGRAEHSAYLAVRREQRAIDDSGGQY